MSVYISLGSNLGDSVFTLERAFVELQKLSVRPIQKSSLWRSTPVDCPPGSPDFVNAAASLEPLQGETPESLIIKLQALEKKFGRIPKEVVNEPRSLDLDIIAFGEEMRETTQLTLPHPRWYQRQFAGANIIGDSAALRVGRKGRSCSPLSFPRHGQDLNFGHVRR